MDENWTYDSPLWSVLPRKSLRPSKDVPREPELRQGRSFAPRRQVAQRRAEARGYGVYYWATERSLVANRTFVLELALAEEGAENSLTALAMVLVSRRNVDASASRPMQKTGITSVRVRPSRGSLDLDRSALRADEGFLLSRVPGRRATKEKCG
jgi:hypothetical protein